MENWQMALLGFLLGLVFILSLVEIFPDINQTPERMLGIPFNVHHDLVGIIFMGSAIVIRNKERIAYPLFGFGLALFVQHIWYEGLVLISALT